MSYIGCVTEVHRRGHLVRVSSAAPRTTSKKRTTAVDGHLAAKLAKVLKRRPSCPRIFTPHPKIVKIAIKSRREMAAGKQPLDWSAAKHSRSLRLLADGRRCAVGPGRPPRHVQPPARGPLRSTKTATPSSRSRTSEADRRPRRDLQQSAVGSRRARFRLRLQPRLPGRPW